MGALPSQSAREALRPAAAHPKPWTDFMQSGALAKFNEELKLRYVSFSFLRAVPKGYYIHGLRFSHNANVTRNTGPPTAFGHMIKRSILPTNTSPPFVARFRLVAHQNRVHSHMPTRETCARRLSVISATPKFYLLSQPTLQTTKDAPSRAEWETR